MAFDAFATGRISFDNADIFQIDTINDASALMGALGRPAGGYVGQSTGNSIIIEHTQECCACGHDHGYELSIEKIGGTLDGVIVATPETDIAGDTTTTASIAIGGTFVDEIEVSGDEDWIAVDLVAGQEYVFTLTGTGTDPLDDPFLELMDASGTMIAENDDGGSGLNSRLRFTADTSGTFYLNAHGWVNSQGGTPTGEYTLTANLYEGLADYSLDQAATFITDEFSTRSAYNNGLVVNGNQVIVYDVSALTAAQANLAELAMQAWEDIAAIDFMTSAEAQAAAQTVGFTGAVAVDITYINTEDGAYNSNSTTSPINGARVILSGTVNVNDGWNNGNTAFDSYTYQTYLHEVGHALGLGHAGPYNGSGSYDQDAIYAQDSWAFSVMSYFDQDESGYGDYRFVLGPQIVDVIAIQDLYGANPNGTRTGDSVYGFNSTETDVHDFSAFTRPPALTIYDTGGEDTIDLTGYSHSQRVNLNPETFSDLGDRGGADDSYSSVISIARDTIIENVVTGSGNDQVTGNGANNEITTGAGNDTVTDGKGNDTVVLGSGNDVVLVGGGVDSFDGGAGTDYISYVDSSNGVTLDLAANTASGSWAVNDTVLNFEGASGSDGGDDTLLGTSGSNTFLGYAGDDRIEGRGGNDILQGGDGDDDVFDGGGNDTVTLGDGNDYVRVGGGVDSFDGGDGVDYISYYSSSNGVTLDLQANTASGSWAVNDTINNFESASGSRTGGDTLYGTSDANTFRSYGGSDEIYGRGGNDKLYAGSGSDDVFDGKGNDYVDLGSGNDYVKVGGGVDTFIGGSGIDYISYYDSSNGVTLDLQANTATGSWAVNDTISGFERASGSQTGNDTLLGTDGANRFRGYGGEDLLDGRDGSDEYYGGSGDDTFVVGLDDGSSQDRIFDFETGDTVRLVDTGWSSFADVQAAMSFVNGNTIITLTSGDTIRIDNTNPSSLQASNFEFTASAEAPGTKKSLAFANENADTGFDFSGLELAAPEMFIDVSEGFAAAPAVSNDLVDLTDLQIDAGLDIFLDDDGMAWISA